jgi:DNA gyrase subunit B
MSVVAALSEWLIHLNRRDNGAWSQRYEHGRPVTELLAIDADGTTGTSLHFLPDPALVLGHPPSPAELTELSRAAWPHLIVEVEDERSA